MASVQWEGDGDLVLKEADGIADEMLNMLETLA
jgi:hypothetical protein